MLVRAQIGYQVIGGTSSTSARDQGRHRLPHVPRQPGGRRRVHPDRQLAEARDRADVALAGPRARGDDGRSRRGRRRRAADDVPTLGTAARQAFGRFMSTMERLQGAGGVRRAGRARCSRRCCGRRAIATRSRRSGRSRPRGGWRTSASSSRSGGSTTGSRARLRGLRSRRVPGADLADRRRGHDARRRGARDADDAPQRQGAGVPDRVHDRLRGRRVPAQPRARRGRRWRRSGGSPTSGSRAPCATSTSPTRGGATCSATSRSASARASSTRSRAS